MPTAFCSWCEDQISHSASECGFVPIFDSDSDSERSPSPAPPTPLPPPSHIQELQSAFGTLLLVQRSNPNEEILGLLRDSSATAKFTGPFRFLDLPRELRDLIYLFSFGGPRIVTRVAFRLRNRMRNGTPLRPLIDIAAFLVNRQMHDEAAETFYRHNTLRFEKGNRSFQRKPIAGQWRLFPERYRVLVQKVRIRFLDYDADDAWSVIRVDSRLAKECFPRLKEFVAVWDVTNGFYVRGTVENGVGEVPVFDHMAMDVVDLGTWLKRREKGLRPPSWLRVEGKGFEVALQKCRKELSWNHDDYLEQGKEWLESVWSDKRPRWRGRGHSSSEAT